MPAIRPRRSSGDPPTPGARRWSLRWLGVVIATAALALLGAGAAQAHPHAHGADAAQGDQGGHGGVFEQRNLVSDIPGVARITDPNLVNPWGAAAGVSTPLWVADNGTNVSTVYTGGVRGSIPVIAPLVVSIPGGVPTGIVYNPTDGFVLHAGPASAPARFIFDSEAGLVTAWSPSTGAAQTVATVPGAVFKGLAIARTKQGPMLYAANFAAARIDVFDAQFAHVTLQPGAFTDPNPPDGYSPFNIQELGGRLYVAYALKEEGGDEEEPGPGRGFVDVYDTTGHLLKRLVSGGQLNAPWGLVLAPKGFGPFGGALLVGNFGDGAINAYDPDTGAFLGPLVNEDGNPIRIDGLWALRFGNGVFGTPRSLIFMAGIADEEHGLLGEIVPRGEK